MIGERFFKGESAAVRVRSQSLMVLAVLVIVVAVLAVAGVALADGRFVDDDGNVHEDNIERIAAAGITKGCNPPVNDRYCPGGNVTRGQMAALLNRALRLPAANRDSFVDDDDSIFENDINRLAAAGITKGCNPPRNDRFCPEGKVTRGQMAAFLVRGFVLRAGFGSDLFIDDDGSVFEGDIDRLGTARVTRGCNPPTNTRYCPDALVKRDQMASLLARALDTTPNSLPPPPTPTPPSGSATLTLAGDFGSNSDATATLRKIAAIRPDAHFLVGDLAYSSAPESEWCDYVHGVVGSSFPFEVLSGNHEDDGAEDGFIRNYAKCMPDRLGVVGDYGVQYYADIGGVVRVIAVAADLEVDGVSYKYEPGSTERRWLESAVADARARGLWVVLAHHKVCISSAEKDCAIGEELADWEAANVDVVVMGHAHNYQRSHQLSCVDEQKVTRSCIADADGDHRRGDGAVFVVNGTGGRHRPVDLSDSEAGYFAALMGEGHPANWGHGVLRLDINGTTLTGTFASGDSTYTDSFTVRR